MTDSKPTENREDKEQQRWYERTPLPTRRGDPQKPSSRPSVGNLCKIVNPNFREFTF
jgi:hypothetical protein